MRFNYPSWHPMIVLIHTVRIKDSGKTALSSSFLEVGAVGTYISMFKQGIDTILPIHRRVWTPLLWKMYGLCSRLCYKYFQDRCNNDNGFISCFWGRHFLLYYSSLHRSFWLNIFGEIVHLCRHHYFRNMLLSSRFVEPPSTWICSGAIQLFHRTKTS